MTREEGSVQEEAPVSHYLGSMFLRQFDWSHSALSAEESMRLYQLLCEHEELFSKGPSDLGRTKVVTHSIPTGSARPIRQLPCRVFLIVSDR